MSLFVLDPGMASRIVDLGRPRSRSLGVPVGGAADAASFRLGNALVGNAPDTPALEVTLKGPILRAEKEIGCVLFGAPFDLAGGRQTLKPNRTFTLSPEEELHIAGTHRGMRAYLCVVGGFETARVLDSHSALEGLARGSVIACRSSRIRTRYLPADVLPAFAGTLRYLPGLQMTWFEPERFFEQSFGVSAALNRMGIRLEGTALSLPDQELVSEPVCPGTVQVTRDGQCIVLGVDGQTIGGYPKIAQVIQADLDFLGQVRPGDTLRFTLVDEQEARTAFLKKRAILDEWTQRARLALDAW